MGRRAAGRASTWWPPAVLLVLGSTLALALAVLTRAHCRGTGWASPDQFTHACYSDVPALVVTGGSADAPPGAALLLRLLAAVAPSARGAFDASVLLLAAALAVAVACLVRAAGPRPWDAALLALSPVLVASVVVSLDLVAVACVAAALLAWARGRPLAAGLLAGLAASVRPVAALVALAAVVLAVRERRPGAAAAAGAGLLVAVAATTLLAAATGDPAGSTWLRELGTGAGYGSLWLLPALAGSPLPERAVLLLWLPATLLALAAVVLLVARSDPSRAGDAGLVARRPGLPAVALLMVGSALVLAPVVPVQATLVVLPLAALAVPRWSAHLPWAAAEVAYAVATWLYLYGLDVPDRGAPAWLYGALLLARLAALAWLVVQPLRPRTGEGLWTSGAGTSAAPVVLTRSRRRPTRPHRPRRRNSPPVTERP